MFWKMVLAFSGLKLLFIPAYHSTDFEVHRNWMAITSSLPYSCWYTEDTSKWTLDYPPLFAWFEYFLGIIAKRFDPNMLNLKNLDYKSFETTLFQRLSVIATDVIYAWGASECCSTLGTKKGVKWGSPALVLAFVLLSNAGLLIVDHIHFQYNGLLFGILLLSVARISQDRMVSAAFWFSLLLNLKHIFLYMAPAYFVFLLRHYCLQNPSNGSLQLSFSAIGRLIKLGVTVLAVFTVSFGPFSNQIGQVIKRLFPFQRGLCHAYWAPNFWALYNAADKAVVIVGKNAGYNVSYATATATGGLVQEFKHVVLPVIEPRTALLLSLVAVLPATWKLWRLPSNTNHFLRCLILCAFGPFLFGWHVHEKAVLLMIIPMSLLAVKSKSPNDAATLVLLSIVGHFSLHPLLFTPFELPRLMSIYLLLLIPLFLFDLASSLVIPQLPFLSLMATSVYCSVGILWAWMRLYAHYLNLEMKLSTKKDK